MALLETIELTKSYGGLRAVNSCSLSVEPGTITGLIGPNGAGKTTLFNLITGFARPDAGEIRFEDERIEGLPPHRIVHRGVVRTFQISREMKAMTVLENLMLVPEGQEGESLWRSWFLPWRVREQEQIIFEKACGVLELLDLRPVQDEYAANLSGGQKKLLELGRTLMAEPKLVLLDEPGAGVNRTLMQRLVNVIQQLVSDQGLTFFIIEHDMDLVTRLCNPIIVMSNGDKLAEGSPEQVRADERVLAAYLGAQFREPP